MDSLNNVDKIREKIKRGHRCLGIGVAMSDPIVTEMIGEIGYDFIMLDLEHGPLSIETALHHVLASRGTDVALFIRVPSHDPVVIKPFLELHPAGIIIPRICSPEDVAVAVSACRYPPQGIRGYGPLRGTRYGGVSQREYLETANEQILVIPQIEHIEAVERIEAVAATPGVDAIMIGPNDLSGTMGLFGHPTHPKMLETIKRIVDAAHDANLPACVGARYDPDEARGWIDMGMDWIAFSNDFANLAASCRTIYEDARALDK